MTIGEMLLSEFDKEMANTRKILECVPEDKFAWKPHDKSSTLGQLANHLAAMPTLAAAVIDGVAKRMPESTSKVELLEALDKKHRDRPRGTCSCEPSHDARCASARQSNASPDSPQGSADCLFAVTRCGRAWNVRAVG